MIVQYDKAYKVRGFMRLTHFLKPRVLDANLFNFPRDSVLHWVKLSDKMENVTRDYVYFKTLSDAYVTTITDYTQQQPEGKFLEKEANILKLISGNVKVCKQFDFIKPGSTKRKKPLTLSIYNYSGFNVRYDYPLQPLQRYYIFRNAYATIFDNLFKVDNDRHKFIIIDLPTKLLRRNEYDKYSKNMSNTILERFPTYESLLMLELWKYIDPNTHKSSIFSLIPINKAKEVNLLFKYNDKFLWLTLNILLRCIKEFVKTFSLEGVGAEQVSFLDLGIEELVMPKIAAKSAEEFKKMFYVMLEQFIQLPAMTDEELAKMDEDLDNEPNNILTKGIAKVKETIYTKVIEPITLTNAVRSDIKKDKNLLDIVNDLKSKNKDPQDQDIPGTGDYTVKKKYGIPVIVNKEEELVDDNLDDYLNEEEEQHKYSAGLVINQNIEDDELDETSVDEVDTDYDAKENITLLDKMYNQDLSDANDLINDLDDILKNGLDYQRVEKDIEQLKKNKQITSQQAKKLRETLAKQKNLKDPFKSKRNLTEMLDDSKDNVVFSSDDVKITGTKVVFDNRYNVDTVRQLRTKYLEQQYSKDLVRCIYSLQNSNFIIDKYEIIDIKDGLGDTQEHHITIRTLDNKTHSVKLILPTLTKEGTFKSNGNEYIVRFQRADLPLKKVKPTVVKISSYYNKLFIQKALYKKTDVGYYLLNCIAKLSNETDYFKDIINISVKNEGIKLPLDYQHFARYIKYFRYKDYAFCFEYEGRKKLFNPELTDTDLKKIEDGKSVLVGRLNRVPIVMDEYSRLFIFKDNKYNEMEDLYELLGISRLNEPVEFAYASVFKYQIPIVYLLCYSYGFNQLIKVLGAQVRYYKPRERINLEVPYYAIKFKDVKLAILRDFGIADMILGGLLDKAKILTNVNSNSLNKKDEILAMLLKLGYTNMVNNEIKLMENLFVDPITLSLLKEYKMPTSFNGLLVKSAEMLLDDYSENTQKITTSTIRGYERLAGLVYKTLMEAIRQYTLSSAFTKAKIKVNSYSILLTLNEDSTTTLVDNLNPMSELKQTEDLSYLGSFGISKDAVAKDSRIVTPEEIGVISEAVRDSGDVGITSYLTATPNIKDIRGNTEELKDTDGVSSMFSSSAMLAPFALSDDTKRLNFNSIMASHIIPINNMRVPYVRTGYDSIVGVRASDKFVVSAEAEGTVTKVTPSSVEVKYGKDTKTYRIKDWTSKEESGACYTHVMAANVKPGDKVRKDDALIYDTLFFEPDIFDRRRVIYKQGDMINVALIEEPATFEDSASISSKLNQRLGTTVTKVLPFVIPANYNVYNIAKPGQEVNPQDILFSYTSSYLSGKEVNKEILDLLKNIQTSSPKAKVKGKISKIIVRYNCDLEEMSESLKEFVIEQDKKLKAETGYTGKVLNNNYLTEGKKLMPGEVEIKYYIVSGVGMGIGDKAIFGNQLKFTVGEVFDNDIVGEHGTPVEAKFSFRSISARIVVSPFLLGTTFMVMEKLQQKAIDLYFGK